VTSKSVYPEPRLVKLNVVILGEQETPSKSSCYTVYLHNEFLFTLRRQPEGISKSTAQRLKLPKVFLNNNSHQLTKQKGFWFVFAKQLLRL